MPTARTRAISFRFCLDVLIDEGFDFITCDRTGGTKTNRATGCACSATTCSIFHLDSLWFRVRDSQSGMWVFRRWVLDTSSLTSDGMALSEEIKLEAMSKKKIIRAKELRSNYKDGTGSASSESGAMDSTTCFSYFANAWGCRQRAAAG